MTSPFLETELVRGQLYASTERLARRTRALRRARVAGREVAPLLAEIAAEVTPHTAATVLDVGCGRGATTGALADRLAPARIIAVDLSHAMLSVARARSASAETRTAFVRADFHELPLADGSCHLGVAAFCLYHSSQPEIAIGEIARCLAPGGAAVFVTKSADSYRELDRLVAESGLDPDATARPGLYASAHSANLPAVVATALEPAWAVHEEHRFVFQDLGEVAEYLSTSPKYVFHNALRSDPAALAAALRTRLPDRPFAMTSLVSYLVARRALATSRPRSQHGDAQTARFTKYYATADRIRAAVANHRWLRELTPKVRFPEVISAGPHHLDFQLVVARHARLEDFVALAELLGELHGAAHAKNLHGAHLDAPYGLAAGHALPEFVNPRLRRIRSRLAQGGVPAPHLDGDEACAIVERAAGPSALYMDANPRNFLITPEGPLVVDADDVTLAPFGYDLAKLVVTLTMTHGPLPWSLVTRSLAAYNAAAEHHGQGLGHVTPRELLDWAEIHHILTSPYLGRGGYRFGWPAARAALHAEARCGRWL